MKYEVENRSVLLRENHRLLRAKKNLREKHRSLRAKKTKKPCSSVKTTVPSVKKNFTKKTKNRVTP
jgi:hypothetical protein